MTDIPNELVETGALAIQRVTSFGHYEATDAAMAALLAVGLPALLERVEAAEGRLAEEQREHDESLALTDAALDQRDALAAKVADARTVLAEISGYGWSKGRSNRLRTALDVSETP